MTLRLLEVDPEQRGTAAQWAEALEHVRRLVALEEAHPSAALPSLLPALPVAEKPAEAPAPALREEVPPKEAPGPVAEESSGASVSTKLSRPRAPQWRGWPWLAMAATGLAAGSMTAAVGMWLEARDESLREPGVAHVESAEEDSADAGTRGLGEAAAATSMEQPPAPSLQEKVAEEPLPEPQPGQTRPNAKGQCPHKGQIALNKGCWLETTSLDREGCAASGGHMFKGLCCVPIIPPGRRPTSSPTDRP